MITLFHNQMYFRLIDDVTYAYRVAWWHPKLLVSGSIHFDKGEVL